MPPLPLLTVIPRVGSRFNHICILPCLNGVMYNGYFGHFLGFGSILVIFRFRGCFGLFQILGVFWSFLGLCGILVIFRFKGYFGQFLGFKSILVIFQVQGYFGLFQVLGAFQSFFRFRCILVFFLDFRSILVGNFQQFWSILEFGDLQK